MSHQERTQLVVAMGSDRWTQRMISSDDGTTAILVTERARILVRELRAFPRVKPRVARPREQSTDVERSVSREETIRVAAFRFRGLHMDWRQEAWPPLLRIASASPTPPLALNGTLSAPRRSGSSARTSFTLVKRWISRRTLVSATYDSYA
jgi:hypothetical protein